MVGRFKDIIRNKPFTPIIMAMILEDHTSSTLAKRLGRSQGLCGRQLKILDRHGWIKKKDPRSAWYTLNKLTLELEGLRYQEDDLVTIRNALSNFDNKVSNWVKECKKRFPSSDQPLKKEVNKYKSLIDTFYTIQIVLAMNQSRRDIGAISEEVAKAYMKSKAWVLWELALTDIIDKNLDNLIPGFIKMKRTILLLEQRT